MKKNKYFSFAFFGNIVIKLKYRKFEYKISYNKHNYINRYIKISKNNLDIMTINGSHKTVVNLMTLYHF